jgi:peptidoglycan-associated lipoprotein
MLALAALGAQACATKGYVRDRVQEASVTAQRDIGVARDSAIRAANETQMAANQQMETRVMNHIDSQIAALRTDINALRTEFNTRVTVMEDSIKFAVPVQFGFDEATVRQEDTAVLQRFANIAKKYYPDSRITIEGFADPAGSQSYNLRLSKQRAEAVRDALVAHGMTTGNLNVVGYGETRLVNPRASREDAGAEMNRRVVFAIETRGSPLNPVTAMLGDKE